MMRGFLSVIMGYLAITAGYFLIYGVVVLVKSLWGCYLSLIG